MKKIFQTFYGKLSAIFLFLLVIMGSVQILITMDTTSSFYYEADQKLNLQLAEHLTPDFEKFLQDSIDHAGIEGMFHYMMVINPKIEIYLLDEQGTIMAFFAEPSKKVKATSVDLAPIHRFLNGSAEMPILGDDPRNPGRVKTFSVAPMRMGKQGSGYLYVVIGGEQYDSAASTIRETYVMETIARGLLITVIFTGIIGLILFAFLTRRLRSMTQVVKDFEKGDLEKRISASTRDEISQLAGTFNHMADTIVANMEELKNTDRLRRELIANISHDLRSPLASIKGYLETIQIKEDELTPPDRQKYIDTILSITNLLEGLVEKLFELSKLDAKQIEPLFEPFSISDLVQDVIMKFKPVAEKAHISLEAAFPEQLPQVYADIGLIERALSNLIENALRYTPEGGSIRTSVLNVDQKIEVSVSDTGYGIEEEELPYIFERFYRVDKSRTPSTGATGLGLAIAKKILEIHNSSISVESKVNVGTTFVFNLDVWQAQLSSN